MTGILNDVQFFGNFVKNVHILSDSWIKNSMEIEKKNHLLLCKIRWDGTKQCGGGELLEFETHLIICEISIALIQKRFVQCCRKSSIPFMKFEHFLYLSPRAEECCGVAPPP